MKIAFINIFSFFTLTICGLSMAQTQKSLSGFQGLTWGSQISSVLAKFPNAKQKDLCKYLANAASSYESVKKKMHEDNSSCLIVEMDNYIVDGINFFAEFSFNSQNRLKLVTLGFTKKQSDREDYLLECTSVYNRISNLLDARYGENIGVTNLDELGKDYTNYSAKAWLPLPTEIWIANLSGSKFIKRLAEISNKPESDVCMVKIHYSKRVSNEALKL